MYRQVKVLAEACEHLELARTKFDAIGFNDVVSRIEQIQNDIYERLGLIGETRIKVEEESEEIETIEPERSTEGENGKEPVIWITEKMGYYYDGDKDQFVIVKKCTIKPVTLKRIDRADLIKLWDSLPNKFTEFDLRKAMNRHGLKLKKYFNYIFRMFAHVLFGGELRTEGKQLFLVKPDEFSLAEENRKQLQLERELIDSKGWGK